VLRTLGRDHFSVEHVFSQVAGRYAKTLSEIDDPYLRERALDIHDVTRRVVRNLMGKHGMSLASINTPHILIAHNLAPSDTAQLNRTLVLGSAPTSGAKHRTPAIMAAVIRISPRSSVGTT
jgi:phosphotransferase system enzyme I (PtsI)